VSEVDIGDQAKPLMVSGMIKDNQICPRPAAALGR
jgi:hypothetical protein